MEPQLSAMLEYSLELQGKQDYIYICKTCIEKMILTLTFVTYICTEINDDLRNEDDN